MMRIRMIFMLVLASLMVGCGLSPQTVALRPVLNVPSPAIGQGRSLALVVVDRRATPAFGSRGGVYDTALITPLTDVAAAVRKALAERLQASGFVIQATEAQNRVAAALALHVEINKIDYRIIGPAIGSPVVNDVQVKALLNATLRSANAGRSLSGTYQAASFRRVAAYPSAADNADLLNKVVATALQQLLQDPKMIDLLRQ